MVFFTHTYVSPSESCMFNNSGEISSILCASACICQWNNDILASVERGVFCWKSRYCGGCFGKMWTTGGRKWARFLCVWGLEWLMTVSALANPDVCSMMLLSSGEVHGWQEIKTGVKAQTWLVDATYALYQQTQRVLWLICISTFLSAAPVGNFLILVITFAFSPHKRTSFYWRFCHENINTRIITVSPTWWFINSSSFTILFLRRGGMQYREKTNVTTCLVQSSVVFKVKCNKK